MSVARAFSGETYSTRQRRFGSAGAGVGGQPVQRPQEGGQRLARPGRRDDQRVLALADRAPGLRLRLRRRREDGREPGSGRGREVLQRLDDILVVRHGSILPRTTDSSVRSRPVPAQPVADRLVSALADGTGELAAGRTDLAHHRALTGRPGLLAGIDVGLGEVRGVQLGVQVAAQPGCTAGRGLLAGRAVTGPGAAGQLEGPEDLRVVRAAQATTCTTVPLAGMSMQSPARTLKMAACRYLTVVLLWKPWVSRAATPVPAATSTMMMSTTRPAVTHHRWRGGGPGSGAAAMGSAGVCVPRPADIQRPRILVPGPLGTQGFRARVPAVSY